MKVSLDWKKGYPEDSEMQPVSAFASEYYRVLVTGRYQNDGCPCVNIVNRMRRKATGFSEFDKDNSLGVPLDGQWHWQTNMVEVIAWCELPNANDPNWIPCDKTLPEETEKIYSNGRMKLLSVMALCEVFKGCPEVKLINRLFIEITGNSYLDQQATDGWIWSNNAGNVRAWMPFPEPAPADDFSGRKAVFAAHEVKMLRAILEEREGVKIMCGKELSGIWLHSKDFETELRLLLLGNKRMTVSRVCFQKRNKGNMTAVKDLLVQMCRSRHIPALVIQCVESQEMVNWCVKNGFVPNPSASLKIGDTIYGDYIKEIN